MRVVSCLVALLLAVPAWAQPQASSSPPTLIPTLLYSVDSPHPDDGDGEFGHALTTVGDLDGDGTTDLLVGAPNEDVGGVLSNGRAYLVAGASGAILRELRGQPDQGAEFGNAVAGVGDVNVDGVPDVAVGAYDEGPDNARAGAAYVFSGATGARLYRWTSPDPEQFGGFGDAIVGPGDLTGDGTPDVVVGDRGRLRIFSGATGTLARTLDGIGAIPLAVAGDVDGDGVVDLVSGATTTSVPGSYRVYGSVSGAVLHEAMDPEPGGVAFAWKLASAGDLDGDGVPEMAASAYREGAPGRLLVFDGATGALVRQIDAPPEVPAGTFTFPRGIAAGDADGDGIPDLAAAGTVDSMGLRRAVYVFSGATGALLAGPFSEPGGTRPASAFGETLAFVRERDGANPAVLAVGAYTADPVGGPQNVGRVYVYALGGSVAASPSPEVSGLAVSVSPNPSAGAAQVAVTASPTGAVRVVVADAIGRVVAVVHEGPVLAGSARVPLPVGLAPGVYAVVAEGAGGVAQARWVVAR